MVFFIKNNLNIILENQKNNYLELSFESNETQSQFL